MKKFNTLIISTSFLLIFCMGTLQYVAHADEGGLNDTSVIRVTPPTSGAATPPTSGAGATVPDVVLENPFKKNSSGAPVVGNLCDLINQILNIIAEIGAIVGVICIIWAGFLFIKAQGNKEEIQKAKNTFYTTVLGLAILLGASVIAKIIFTTVSSITSSFNSGANICAAPSSSSSTTTPTPTGTTAGPRGAEYYPTGR